MKPFILCSVTMLVISMSVCSAQAQASTNIVQLNNEGIEALNKTRLKRGNWTGWPGWPANLKESDYEAIISKFKEALHADPTYSRSRENLAIAHNNFALWLYCRKHKVDESLEEFHSSLYIDPWSKNSENSFCNMCDVWFALRKNPNSFEDRVELGDKARASNDLPGAIVEYAGALGLKEDNEVRKKLNGVCGLMRPEDPQVSEYCSALLKVQADPRLHKLLADELEVLQMHDSNVEVNR